MNSDKGKIGVRVETRVRVRFGKGGQLLQRPAPSLRPSEIAQRPAHA